MRCSVSSAGTNCSNRSRPSWLPAAGIRAVAGSDTSDARDFRRRLAREMFVVLHGDGSIAGAQHDRAAYLGRLDVFAVDAALRRPAILHPGYIRDR